MSSARNGRTRSTVAPTNVDAAPAAASVPGLARLKVDPGRVRTRDDRDERRERRGERRGGDLREAAGGSNGVGAVPPAVREALLSPGKPLAPATRAEMERRFGHDFGQVRVHAGPRAAEAARRLDSLAFTSGQDIFFGAGRYRPETTRGRRLLAHELAHTLQQRTARRQPEGPVIQRSLAVSQPGDPLEREAAAAADRVAAGLEVAPGTVSLAANPAAVPIARQVATLAGEDRATRLPDAEDLVRDLVDVLLRSLQTDPEDRFGNIRRQLARLGPTAREAVLERVRSNGSPEQLAQLDRVLAKPPPSESEDLPIPEGRAEPETAPDPAPQPSPEADAEETRAGRRGPEPGISPEGEAVPDSDLSAPSPGEPGPGHEPQPDTAASPEGEGTEAPEPIEAEAGDLAAPEVEAAVPDLVAEAGAAPPSEEAAGPAAATADAAPTAENVEEGAEPDTGPLEELEAEEEAEAEAATEPPAPEEAPSEEAPSEEAASGTPEAAPSPEVDAAAASGPETAGSEAAVGSTSGDPTAAEPVSEEPDPMSAPPEAEAAEEGQEATAEDLELPEVQPGAEDASGDGLDPGAGIGGGPDMGDELPGGGGGVGVAIAEAPAPEVPDVSGADPAEALSTVGELPPARLAAALGGVSAAASRSVAEQREELAANPPQMERPSGSTAVGAEAAVAGESLPPVGGPRQVERVPQGSPAPVPRPEPLPPAPVPQIQAVRPPMVGGGSQQGLSEDEARAVLTSVRSLPTRDPALAITAGPAPTLPLEGDADPEQARKQRTEMEASVSDAHLQGQRAAAEPMGEDEIYPDVPRETLTAEVPAGGAGAAGPAGPTTAAGAAPAGGPAGADDEAASIVAREQRGEEIRAAVARARADVTARRQEHTERAAEERAKSQREVDDLVNQNAAGQARERAEARTEVRGLRDEYAEDQRTLVDEARTDADAAGRQGQEDLSRERTQAEEKASKHVEEGDQKAADARREGENKAARERERAENESGGILGWLADRAKAFFEGVKARIQQAFEAARKAVRDAIQRAQQLAAEVIEKARQAVVGIIRRVGDALIAIGDRVLSRFPGLRDRFRAAVRERVAKAEAAVNRLAAGLKEGVQRALNLLGAALDAALGLLERGMLAAVDAVGQAVQGAIQAARSVVQALAAFAGLIRDVAANPGQWIRNLGAAIVDGIRNHLWQALKTAIRNWFSSKVEEVLGLGTTVWQLLRRGGVSLARIGRMVWEGLKKVIPVVLIQILIQRLISMIVPAVGAVMAIIEALQAAWGTVSRIIQAFERFFAFLRAVKTGNAGPQFAEALAAAAVAVIDFVSNFMLVRLSRRAGALAGRVRAFAQRIGQRLRRLTGTLRRGMRRLRRGARGFAARLRGRGGRLSPSERRREARRRRRQDAEERLRRAARELTPRIFTLLERGVSRLRLRLQLAWWRRAYRLRSLTLVRRGQSRLSVVAQANPTEELIRAALETTPDLIHERLRHVWGEVLRDRRIQLAIEDIQTRRRQGFVPGAPGRAPAVDVAQPVGAGTAPALDLALGARVGPGGPVRPRGTVERTTFGSESGAPLVVSERVGRHVGPGPTFISTLPEPDYPGIVREIGSDPAVAAGVGRAMIQIQRTGRIAPGTNIGSLEPRHVAGLVRLFQLEAGRSVLPQFRGGTASTPFRFAGGAFVTTQLLVQLMARGDVSAREAFMELHQMHPEGAMQTARRTSRELERRAAGQPSRLRSVENIEDVRLFLERQREPVVRWLVTRTYADPYVFQTVERFDRFIKREVVDYLVHHILSGTLLELPEERP